MNQLISVPNQADVVIVTPLVEERDAVLEHLPGYQRLMPSAAETEVYYWADTTAGRIAVLPLTGMGRVAGAVATDAAIDRWQPEYVILVGIAGGVADRGVKLGDVLIADQVVDYSLQKVTAEGSEIRWQVFPTDHRLLTVALNLEEEEWQGLSQVDRPGKRGAARRHCGPIASGDQVIAFKETLARYQDPWTKLVGVEMEAGGVAVSSLRAASRPRFFMVRGVSDLADEAKGSTYVKRWRSYACDVAAAFTIALLQTAPLNRTPAVPASPPPAPTPSAPTPATEPVPGGNYNLKKIRLLLTEGFSDRDLRRLCFDEHEFKAVYAELSSGSGKSEIIEKILEHAEQSLQMEFLLKWAGENNPAKYRQHAPYR